MSIELRAPLTRPLLVEGHLATASCAQLWPLPSPMSVFADEEDGDAASTMISHLSLHDPLASSNSMLTQTTACMAPGPQAQPLLAGHTQSRTADLDLGEYLERRLQSFTERLDYAALISELHAAHPSLELLKLRCFRHSQYLFPCVCEVLRSTPWRVEVEGVLIRSLGAAGAAELAEEGLLHRHLEDGRLVVKSMRFR